jgi:hypothetical protein
MTTNTTTAEAPKYHYTEVISVGPSGAKIRVDGDAVLTSWPALRAAADQDADHYGRPVDDTTRELARRYRILLATAYGMWIEQARKTGRLLVLRKFEVGCRFGTSWGLAHESGGEPIAKTGVEPFGSSSGISYLEQWADEHGYAIGGHS